MMLICRGLRGTVLAYSQFDRSKNDN